MNTKVIAIDAALPKVRMYDVLADRVSACKPVARQYGPLVLGLIGIGGLNTFLFNEQWGAFSQDGWLHGLQSLRAPLFLTLNSLAGGYTFYAGNVIKQNWENANDLKERRYECVKGTLNSLAWCFLPEIMHRKPGLSGTASFLVLLAFSWSALYSFLDGTSKWALNIDSKKTANPGFKGYAKTLVTNYHQALQFLLGFPPLKSKKKLWSVQLGKRHIDIGSIDQLIDYSKRGFLMNTLVYSITPNWLMPSVMNIMSLYFSVFHSSNKMGVAAKEQ